MRLFVSFLAIVLLEGCVRKNLPVTPPAVSSNNSFLDLQVGWRLRAIVPLTKSGTINPPPLTVTQQNGLALTLQASPDLVGYETQYYGIRKSWANLRIGFASAIDTEQEISSERAKPVVDLFPGHPEARHLRLLYLTRVSGSDHNMALLGASGAQSLSDLTEKVQRNPESCRTAKRAFCLWIPVGIALRPELRLRAGGNLDWEPAQ